MSACFLLHPHHGAPIAESAKAPGQPFPGPLPFKTPQNIHVYHDLTLLNFTSPPPPPPPPPPKKTRPPQLSSTHFQLFLLPSGSGLPSAPKFRAICAFPTVTPTAAASVASAPSTLSNTSELESGRLRVPCASDTTPTTATAAAAAAAVGGTGGSQLVVRSLWFVQNGTPSSV